MTDLLRVRLEWTGWAGGPGYTILHFSQGNPPHVWNSETYDQLQSEIQAFTNAMKPYIARGVTITTPPGGEVIDAASGKIVDECWGSNPAAESVSSATGEPHPYSTSVLIRFRGDRWINGRKAKGHMFFGPCSQSVGGNGQAINSSFRALVQDNFVAMTSGAGPRLAIYHRPRTKASMDGTWSDVTIVDVSQKLAVLTSRRD